jgi:amino acid transporter
MTTKLLCIVYFFIFAALIKLRYTKPEVLRPFRIPSGIAEVRLVGDLGLFCVCFAFIVELMPLAFFPNAPIHIGEVLMGTLLLAVPPMIFLKFKKP